MLTSGLLEKDANWLFGRIKFHYESLVREAAAEMHHNGLWEISQYWQTYEEFALVYGAIMRLAVEVEKEEFLRIALTGEVDSAAFFTDEQGYFYDNEAVKRQFAQIWDFFNYYEYWQTPEAG